MVSELACVRNRSTDKGDQCCLLAYVTIMKVRSGYKISKNISLYKIVKTFLTVFIPCKSVCIY